MAFLLLRTELYGAQCKVQILLLGHIRFKHLCLWQVAHVSCFPPKFWISVKVPILKVCIWYFFSKWNFDQLNICSTFFSSKLDSPSPMFWLEENLIISNVLITEEFHFHFENVQEMFNWSEVHSEKKYYSGLYCLHH